MQTVLDLDGGQIFVVILILLVLLVVYKGVAVVSQSEVYVIERVGKFTRTLSPGLNLIVPFLDRISHRVSILERQLPEFQISVITRDNVDVTLEATVFYRITDAAHSVYRIRDASRALHTEATSIVRSAAGQLELDELQSSRDSMNLEVSTNLQRKADEWGVEITSTAITDVIVDAQTKASQRQQLNAERERRAAIARAEGEKRAAELSAEADLYTAQRQAEGLRVTADANAYAVAAAAKADSDRTRIIGNAISEAGTMPLKYEILKQQMEAMSRVAASPNSKTLLVPSDTAAVIGSMQVILEQLQGSNGNKTKSPQDNGDKDISMW